MLRVSGLEKHFAAHGGRVAAVRGVTFTVARGEFYTLLGPSGCGKTTTLHCIAGLETPDGGEIAMADQVVFCADRAINVPAHRRDLGMVFQSYAIWPHMTVYDNVAFPLIHGHRRGRAGDVRARVMRALEMVKLEALADRPAPFLSGGQQQRVAVARALVHEPELLLFDEPLSNLDAKLREEMRTEIRELTTTLGITTVYVTHDQVEALAMSDKIAVMKGGVIVQEGSPRDVYLRPHDAFAADFMGGSNIVAGTVAETTRGEFGMVETPIGRFACRLPHAAAAGQPVDLVLRPEAFRLRNGAADGINPPNVVAGTIEHASFIGESVEVRVRVGDQALRVRLDALAELAPQQPVRLEAPAERCVAIRPSPSQAG
ncbi:MAG: ABC transporter ATP-binding protein [Rhodospirillales bacterium]